MRGGIWLLAAAVCVAVIVAVVSRDPVPDPIGRGTVAADFSLPLLPEGEEPISLEGLRGRVVLLNFWATWCAPCEKEMPAMQRLHEALEPEGLVLLAVSVDEESEPVVRFARRLELDFPIAWDPDHRVADAYQASRFPETLLIDREGVVVERYIGPREWDSPLYVARIRRLLEGGEQGP